MIIYILLVELTVIRDSITFNHFLLLEMSHFIYLFIFKKHYILFYLE